MCAVLGSLTFRIVARATLLSAINMLNREIVKLFLFFGRKKEKVVEFFVTKANISEITAVRDVDRWIRQFYRRWNTSHASNRFYERNKDWLDTTFLVSIILVKFILTERYVNSMFLNSEGI